VTRAIRLGYSRRTTHRARTVSSLGFLCRRRHETQDEKDIARQKRRRETDHLSKPIDVALNGKQRLAHTASRSVHSYCSLMRPRCCRLPQSKCHRRAAANGPLKANVFAGLIIRTTRRIQHPQLHGAYGLSDVALCEINKFPTLFFRATQLCRARTGYERRVCLVVPLSVTR